MKIPTLGAVVRVVKLMLADLRANEPLPPGPASTPAQVVVTLEKVRKDLPGILLEMKQYPGRTRAVIDGLKAMKAAGMTKADDLISVLESAPGILEEALTLIPLAEDYEKVQDAFAPAPNPFPGMGPRVGRG